MNVNENTLHAMNLAGSTQKYVANKLERILERSEMAGSV